MFCRRFLIVTLVLLTVNVHSKKAKPASQYFNICRRGDAKALSECVKQNLIDLKPQFKKGIPDLGLAPLEPLVIPRMELVQGVGTFAFNTTLTNLTIHGLGEYTVYSVNLNFDKNKLESHIGLTTPEMIMTANYAMSGQILVIPIQGQGSCEMNFTDVTTVMHMLGHVVKRNDVDYVEITSMKWDIKVEGSRSWFYNLFNGDKLLGDATNRFLNDNAKEAFEAFKHLPEEAFGEVFKELSSKVFNAYPLNELFLE